MRARFLAIGAAVWAAANAGIYLLVMSAQGNSPAWWYPAVLGTAALLFLLAAGRLWPVPLLIIGATLVTGAALAGMLSIGLLLSSAVKNQLVASQLAALVTFMPALMLSGFLFDLHSMPPAVRVVTYLLPARYYVALLQTVFLAGDAWSVIVPNTLVLALMAVVLALGSLAITRKRLA